LIFMVKTLYEISILRCPQVTLTHSADFPHCG
jgi:hypothetical protein